MTREAINELKKYTLGKKNTEKVEISVLQIKRVIKALEQEPCEDAISRQAVLNLINADWKYEGLEMDVASLPPVNPQEPKTGHWIKYSIPRCGEQHYQCTNCDYYINFGQWGELYTKEFKYCPNCGAKMEETADEQTIERDEQQGALLCTYRRVRSGGSGLRTECIS